MAISLCNAAGISYKAYARSFREGEPPVIYVMASCWMMNSVSKIFFARDSGLTWKLMQDVPSVIDTLLTYYQAAATTSQPTLGVGTTITVIDAFGSHPVPLQAWDALSVDDGSAPGAEYVEGATGTTQLARGSGISYKAFSMPYDSEGGTVIFLYATCSYPTGGWNIFFSTDGSNQWALYETVPGFPNHLVTYYIAGFTSAFGLQTNPTSVQIRDGYGTHSVPVEAWSTSSVPASAGASAPGVSAATPGARIDI
jgi:hypothetical protein